MRIKEAKGLLSITSKENLYLFNSLSSIERNKVI